MKKRDAANRIHKRKKAAEWMRKKLSSDPAFAILHRLRARTSMAIREIKTAKKLCNTMQLVGCTTDELMLHLQSQFKPGMAWNNRHLWHIDHIRPCASFDLLDAEQQRQCFHYTNLQPLWAMENLSKGSKQMQNAATGLAPK